MDIVNSKRILIVDDNPEVHKDFAKILKSKPKEQFDDIQNLLFDKKTKVKPIIFENLTLDLALQGIKAVKLVKSACDQNQPYSVAFIDVRMPPGWDGIQTIKKIWEIDPHIQIVICTAYSDYSWEAMFQELDGSENFLILKKPFDKVEARQLVASLTKKWEYKRRIEDKVVNLETAISERTAEMRYAMQMAEDANQLKTNFLRNISLELRTPLNAIIGFTELMYHDKIDQTNIKEYYSDVLSSAKYLSEMIDNILDISKLEESYKINLEKINIKLLINEILDMFTLLIKEKKLQVKIDIHPTLIQFKYDPNILKQVLRHYISNAIKFNSTDGKVVVRIMPVMNNAFKIEVTDTGIGIREENLKKLFIPFQQLDMTFAKKYSGTGLGLALTKRIVELQGGTVSAKSKFGEGSTFFAVLPLNLNTSM